MQNPKLYNPTSRICLIECEDFRIENIATKEIYNILFNYGSVENVIRSYSKFTSTVCSVCGSTRNDKVCHKHLVKNGKVIPSKIVSAGIYSKNNPDRLVKDFNALRYKKDENRCDENEIIILALLAAEIIQTSFPQLNKAAIIPSRINTKPCLPKLIRKTLEILDIEEIDLETIIIHDNELHNQTVVKNLNNPEIRQDQISDIFKRKSNSSISLKGMNVLLIDDVVETGLTMNRIGDILVNEGVAEVYGFCWLRAVESVKLYS